MKFRVEVTATAKKETEAAYLWLEERSPKHAATWFDGLANAVQGLSDLPSRWSLARESKEFDENIRQLLYGKRPHVYRVLFVVRGDAVYVLHVRHGARPALRRGEIGFPDIDSGSA